MSSRILLLALSVAACDGAAPPRPAGAVDTLPRGPWVLAARGAGSALLVAAEEPAGGRVPVLEWRPAGGPFRTEAAAILRVTLPGGAGRDLLRVGRGRVGGDVVLFGLPRGGPPLLPLEDGGPTYVLEAAGTLWTVSAAGEARRLVADSVGPYRRQRLEALQREGEVILYWAAVPVVAPGGELVAFVTNRESVARGEVAGQSIWVVEPPSGTGRPLVSRPRASYRPEGWLGDELVFIGSFRGVRAVHPDDRSIRQLSEGTLVAVSPDGSALAVTHGVPDSTRLEVLLEGRWLDASPPPGTVFAPQATFAPDGSRLLVQASTRDGRIRAFGVLLLDESPTTLHWIDLPAPPTALDAWPVWLDGRTILATAGSGRHAGTSWAVRVP